MVNLQRKICILSYKLVIYVLTLVETVITVKVVPCVRFAMQINMNRQKMSQVVKKTKSHNIDSSCTLPSYRTLSTFCVDHFTMM